MAPTRLALVISERSIMSEMAAYHASIRNESTDMSINSHSNIAPVSTVCVNV